MKVSVETLGGKKFTVEAESFDTVYNLKAKILDKENISINQQRLFMSFSQSSPASFICSDSKVLLVNGMQLDNSLTLADCYNWSDSNADLEVILFEHADQILTDNNEFKPTLNFEPILLEQREILSKELESTLKNVSKSSGQMSIFIDTCSDKGVIMLDVKSTETIASVKAKIQGEEQTLYFSNDVLQDHHDLTFYLIKNGSILRVVRESCKISQDNNKIKDKEGILQQSCHPMKVSIETMLHKKMTLEAESFNTILELKAKIQEKEGIPCGQQQLSLGCIGDLEDDCTLASYCICCESKLVLKPRPGSQMNINIKYASNNGKTFSLQVKTFDTILDVKTKINKDVPADQQILSFNNKDLKDDRTLDDYDIVWESILTLVTKSSSERIKIYIKNVVGKIFSVMAESFDTISEVKAKIEEMEEIPRGQQMLMLLSSANELPNKCKLADCSIKNKSTLNLRIRYGKKEKEFKVYIAIENGRTFPLDVKSSETIHTVKSNIEKTQVIPSDQQNLCFHSELDNSLTVARYGIYTGCTLELMPVLQKKTTIFINTFTGNTFPLVVKTSDTFGQVKAKIYKNTGVPSFQQRLMFDDGCLYDNLTLYLCCIRWDSTLYVALRGEMQILVNMVNGKTIALKVESWDTIFDVKVKIQKKEDVLAQQLILSFKGMQLDNSLTLGDYYIWNHTTLDLEVILLEHRKKLDKEFFIFLNEHHKHSRFLDSKGEMQMQILVKMVNGKTIALNVKRRDTIFDVKVKIENEEGVLTQVQMLIYNGMELDDRLSLGDYYIRNHTTLDLEVKVLPEQRDQINNVHSRSSGPMEIIIDTCSDKGIILLDVESTDTIARVKAKIQAKKGIPRDQQILLLDGNELKDDHDLAFYGIGYKSVLRLGQSSHSITTGETTQLKVESASSSINDVKTKMKDKQQQQSSHVVKKLTNNKSKSKSTLTNVSGSSGQKMMTIFIERYIPGEKKVLLEVKPTDTIGDVKTMILEKTGIPSNDQQLVYKGEKLKDNCKLSAYNIKNKSTLSLMQSSFLS